MAKFGTGVLYGGGVTGDVYGTGDANQYLFWDFSVFWDDAFVNEAEVSEMTDFSLDRGRDHLLSSGGGWERFRPGEAQATFNNDNGRFDPYNSAGPLYGFLLPGRVVRISVDVLPPYADTLVNYPLMRGIIDDMQQFFRDGQRQARIVVKDGLEWLAGRSIALALVEDDEALLTAAAIASQVGFDDVDDWSVVQLGADSVAAPYAFGNEPSSLALINELVDAEAGQVFHGKDGVLTLVTNDYTETETIDIDTAEILRDFELKQPWEVVRTRAVVTANPLAEGTPAVLWTYGNEGEVATWTAETAPLPATTPYLFKTLPGTVPTSLSVDAPFSGVEGTATSPTVDYEAVIGEEGSAWVDVSASGSLVLTSEDIGTGLRLTWTWSGSTDYTHLAIIFADITATPVAASDPVTVTASDLAAAVIYGEKTFTLDNAFVQDQGYAQSYADYVVVELAAAHLFPTIQIENRPELQYSPELYTTKIHLTIPAYGIDDTFRVGKIAHKWLNENGIATQTLLRLEPVLGALG